MANWVYMNSDGVIEEFHDDIPDNWRNVSNFYVHKDDLETLQKFGWYSVKDITQPLTNSTTQKYGDAVYTFDSDNNIVIQNSPIITINHDSDILFNDARSYLMKTLREHRDYLLSKTDWTQLSDVQSLHTEDWQKNILSYRNALRNLPDLYEKEYPELTDISQINYPTPPEF